MMPTSEQLEAFLERLQGLDRDLSKQKQAECRADTVAEIKNIARDWLRLSEALRASGVFGESSTSVDFAFKEMFQSTATRARASAYRSKLATVLGVFTDAVVVPLIRFEGTPSQAAARQVLSEFASRVSVDEQAYLEEATRCLSSRCNRAAIILLWAAAVARLHSAVGKLGFNAYNAAIDQTGQKKGSPFNRVAKQHISSLPELQRSREFDLLVVGMELWKYDLQAFEELDRLLGIRNNAAHPGMLKPSSVDVQQYASKLNTYIFGVVPM